MAHITRHIGLSLGADICWPICFEEIMRRLKLKIAWKGDTLGFDVSRVTIEPFDLCQPCRYDVVIDRLTHWYHVSREWIKKAVVLDDLYVFNNPWSIQANEKHTTYCAMMRLGLPIPETWMVPPKAYDKSADLEATLQRYAQLFDIGTIGEQIGYPLFMKPYDGGGWVGVTKIDDEAALRAAYEASGTKIMHLQAGVIPYDKFVRCIGLGPQTRVVNYDPSAPAARSLPHGSQLPVVRRATQARGHHPHDQRVLRLGFQLLRGAAQEWRVVSDRFRQRLPRLAGDFAPLSFSMAHQVEPALVDLLRSDQARHAPESRLGAVLRDRRPGPVAARKTARLCPRSRASTSRPTPSRNSAPSTWRTWTRSPTISLAAPRRATPCARK